ncbi:MAG: hypothetical protein AB7U59_17700 [Desulfovibrionaceae bacterium]
MKRLMALVLATVVLSMTGVAAAEEKTMLFKSFAYGSSQDEINKLIKVSKCGKTMKGNTVLCADNYMFFKKKWKILFVFEDDRLNNVRLDGRLKQSEIITLVRDVSETFVLIGAQGGNGFFDYINTVFTQGVDKATVMLSNFEVVARSVGPVTYSFVDKGSFESLIEKHRSAQDIMINAAPTLRELDIIINGDGSVEINFFAPGMTLKEAVKDKPALQEKF